MEYFLDRVHKSERDFATWTFTVYPKDRDYDEDKMIESALAFLHNEHFDPSYRRRWRVVIVVPVDDLSPPNSPVSATLRCPSCQTVLLDGSQCDCTKYD